MMLKTVLTISAIYLGVLGIGFMFAPEQVGVGAVPADPSPALVAYLRICGGPMVGIAVLNCWPGIRRLPRHATPSFLRTSSDLPA